MPRGAIRVSTAFVCGQLYYVGTLDVDDTLGDGDANIATIGGAGTSNRTHGTAVILIDEDVLLSGYQLFKAGHLHIGVSGPCRHCQQGKCEKRNNFLHDN